MAADCEGPAAKGGAARPGGVPGGRSKAEAGEEDGPCHSHYAQPDGHRCALMHVHSMHRVTSEIHAATSYWQVSSETSCTCQPLEESRHSDGASRDGADNNEQNVVLVFQATGSQ